jgi:hypothetical protein
VTSATKQLAAREIAVTLSVAQPVWLPATGASLYRRTRKVLRDGLLHAGRGRVKLAVVDLPGKSRIELMATIRCGQDRHLTLASFDRQLTDPLAAGFAECADPGERPPR